MTQPVLDTLSHPYDTTEMLWRWLTEDTGTGFWLGGGEYRLKSIGVDIVDGVLMVRNHDIRILARSAGTVPYDNDLIQRLYKPETGRVHAMAPHVATLILNFSQSTIGTTYLVLEQQPIGSATSHNTTKYYPFLSGEPLFEYEEDAVMYKLKWAELQRELWG